ncbi:hypothetical protein JZ751_029295, partial [Albula glossodonta]
MSIQSCTDNKGELDLSTNTFSWAERSRWSVPSPPQSEMDGRTAVQGGNRVWLLGTAELLPCDSSIGWEETKHHQTDIFLMFGFHYGQTAYERSSSSRCLSASVLHLIKSVQEMFAQRRVERTQAANGH